MDEEVKLQEERDRALKAKLVITNVIYVEAWAQFEQRLMGAWNDTHVDETDKRETIWLALNVGRKVRRHLEDAMQTGVYADIQLEELYGKQAKHNRPN